MYDTSFDNPAAQVPRSDRKALWGLRIAALIATILAASADAQMPGAPILQNAWATSGIVAAIDLGTGSGGAVYAGAVAWAPGSGRFQLSGGAGVQTGTGTRGTGSPGGVSRGVYGIRAAVPFSGAESTIGFAGFAGIGGGPAKLAAFVNPFNGSINDSVASTTEIPVGVAIGWRRAFGATNGLSLYATPSYVFLSGGGKTSGLVRASIGADFGLTSALGATAGIEFGATRPPVTGGPSGTRFGLGLSYALGRR